MTLFTNYATITNVRKRKIDMTEKITNSTDDFTDAEDHGLVPGGVEMPVAGGLKEGIADDVIFPHVSEKPLLLKAGSIDEEVAGDAGKEEKPEFLLGRLRNALAETAFRAVRAMSQYRRIFRSVGSLAAERVREEVNEKKEAFRLVGAFAARRLRRVIPKKKEMLGGEVLDNLDRNWDFDIDSGGFVLQGGEQAAEDAVKGGYESMKKLIPDADKVFAEDSKLDPRSEDFDSSYAIGYFCGSASENIGTFFGENYENMPRLAGIVRASMQEQTDNLHSLDNKKPKVYGAAVQKLMDSRDLLPKELAEDFDDTIFDEITAAVLEGCHDGSVLRECCKLLAARGFPPERWVQDVKKRKDCPEFLRQLVAEGKESLFDKASIQFILEESKDKKLGTDTSKLMGWLQEFYEDRLPDMNDAAVWSYVSDIIGGSLRVGDGMIEILERYIDNIREIGQDKANTLYEKCGIVHFSGWSTSVLEGTEAMLRNGRTESGGPATLVVRGVTGDHNNVFEYLRFINSGDVFAAEIGGIDQRLDIMRTMLQAANVADWLRGRYRPDTDDLLGVVECMQKAGLNKVERVVLAGHGSEKRFSMTSYTRIPPKPKKWARNKGISTVMNAFHPNVVSLISCNPIAEDPNIEPLSISDVPQERQGTAPAISRAYPDVDVVSVLDGVAAVDNRRSDAFIVATMASEDADNPEIPDGDFEDVLNSEARVSHNLAVTKDGKTRLYHGDSLIW